MSAPIVSAARRLSSGSGSASNAIWMSLLIRSFSWSMRGSRRSLLGRSCFLSFSGEIALNVPGCLQRGLCSGWSGYFCSSSCQATPMAISAVLPYGCVRRSLSQAFCALMKQAYEVTGCLPRLTPQT
jgi:hypothetical protein